MPMPMAGGMPPQGGGPGGAPGLPGVMGDPTAEMSLSAMGQLTPQSSNPTEAMARVDEALSMAHQLVMTSLPQISQWDAKVAKELHEIGRRILTAKMSLHEEQAAMMPPPPLGMGPGGAMGTPPGGGGAPMPGGSPGAYGM